MDRYGYFFYVPSTAKKKKISLMQPRPPRVAFVDEKKRPGVAERVQSSTYASAAPTAAESIREGSMTHRGPSPAPRARLYSQLESYQPRYHTIRDNGDKRVESECRRRKKEQKVVGYQQVLRSDSEYDIFEAEVKPEVKPKPKRKPVSTFRETNRTISSAKKPKSCKKELLDVLGLLSEDEETIAVDNAQRAPARGKQLESSISSRVANGSLVHRALHDGQYYIETRVYTTEEALTLPPELRYTKALVTLKVQLDREHPEWTYLQRFMQKVKSSLFADSKPIFYSNKK